MAQSKAQTSKSRSVDARARAQAQRQAIARQERNRKLMFGGLWSGVALVVILVIVFVVINQVDTSNGKKKDNQAATQSVIDDITKLPESAFASAGTSGVQTASAGLTTVNRTPILTGGKPTVVYVGAEFCPYCAAERWALASALSRFGTLSGLETIRSAATDGNYATLSFVNASYSSPYIALSATEQEDRGENLIKNPPAAEDAIFTKYGKGQYPFLSINEKYQAGGAQYDASLLGTMSAEQIADIIRNQPTSTLGSAVLGSANILTAGICAQTGQMPANVCGASEVKAAAADLDVTAAGSGTSSSGS